MPCPALTAGTHPSTPAAAIPDWLPAWSNQTALQLNLAAACSLKPLPRAYANATLCVNDQKSPLLAAALGGGLAGPGSCGGPCVYNPAPLDGDTAVTAWRWDTDNVCWMQDTRNVQSCPLDASSSAASIARWAAGSMQRDKQLVDWLALPALNEAWAAYHSAGSGPALEDDPTGALAHEAFFLELVDALASSAAATKLAALPAGDPIAAMQAKLVEEFRCVAVPACWLAGVLPGWLAGFLVRGLPSECRFEGGILYSRPTSCLAGSRAVSFRAVLCGVIMLGTRAGSVHRGAAACTAFCCE
jgi:hypothetical protein